MGELEREMEGEIKGEMERDEGREIERVLWIQSLSHGCGHYLGDLVTVCGLSHYLMDLQRV